MTREMARSRLRIAVLGTVIMAEAAANCHAGILYGVEVVNDVLQTVDPVSGLVETVGPYFSAPPAFADAISGLAFDSVQGSLYGVGQFQQSSRLYRVDMDTGAAAPVNPSSDLGFVYRGGLAFDANRDRLYATSGSRPGGPSTPLVPELYTVDPNTGTGTFLTEIHPVGINSLLFTGLAYDPVDDVLYGLHDMSGGIAIIDMTTGNAYPLISLPGVNWSGLEFDPDRRLLLASNVGIVLENQGTTIIAVDPLTRQIVSSIVVGQPATAIHGLAYVPEPTPALFFLLGALLVMRRQSLSR